jgi:hypothetical protein
MQHDPGARERARRVLHDAFDDAADAPRLLRDETEGNGEEQ